MATGIRDLGTGRTRVLTVIDSLAVGGAERVAVDIANTLDRSSFEVAFCATRSGGPLADALADDVPLTVLGRSKTWDLSKVVKFASLVRKGGFDLVHSHGRGSMQFVALARAARLIRVPHVFHDHFGLVETNTGAPIGLRMALRLGVDCYVGVDDRLCRWAHDIVGLPSEKVRLLRSGVDLSRFDQASTLDLRAAFGLPADSIVAVMIANFRRQKDHRILFHALAALSERTRSQLHVLLIGSTDVEPDCFAECQSLIDQLGIQELVRIVGPRDDVPSLLAGADFGLLCSASESGPLVLLEYMAAGLPFVATDTGEIANAVRDLGVGSFVPPGDSDALAAALAALLGLTPAEREASGRRCREVVVEHFSQRAVTRKLEDVYRQVLSGECRAGVARVR